MKKLLHILSRQRSLSLRSLRPHQKAVSSDSDGTFRNHPPSPLTLPSDGSSNGSLGDDDDNNNNNKDNTEPTTTTTTTQTSDDSASLQESTQLGILKIYEDLYYEHERMLARERPQSKKKKDTVWKKHITNRQNKSGSKSMSAPAAAATATDPPSSSASSSATATSYNMLTRITSFKSVRSSFWKHSQSEPNKPRQQQKRAMICTPIAPAARTSTLLITRVASNASASITEAFLSVDDDDGHLSIASNEFDDIEDRLSIDTPVFDSLIEQEKDKTDYLLDDEEEADLLLDDDVSSVTSFFGEFEDDLLEVELEMDDGGDEALCGSCTADDLAAYTTMFLQDASTCLGLDAKQEKKPRRGLQQTIRRPAKPTRRAQTAQIIRERVTQLV